MRSQGTTGGSALQSAPRGRAGGPARVSKPLLGRVLRRPSGGRHPSPPGPAPALRPPTGVFASSGGSSRRCGACRPA